MAPLPLVVPLGPVLPVVGAPAPPVVAPPMVLPGVVVAPGVPVPLMAPLLPVELAAPPAAVAAESVPSVLLGVLVLVLVLVSLWLLPQLLSKVPPSSTAARGKEVLKKRIKLKMKVKARMPFLYTVRR